MANTIITIPTNDEIKNKYVVPNDIRINEETRLELDKLYKSNHILHHIIMQDMKAANEVAKRFTNENTGKPFDFAWEEYTLRDIVIQEFDTQKELNETLRMLELNDAESSKILKCIKDDGTSYAIISLYYGAPADSEYAFSHIRFIDIMAYGGAHNIERHSFFRYTKELCV